MAIRLLSLVLIAAFGILGVSCKKSKPDTALAQQEKFQAQQKALAIKAYQDLVKKYPDSEYAEKAQERLRALGPAATPARK